MRRLILLALIGLIGCVPAALPRDQVMKNITPVLKLERRSDSIRASVRMLGAVGKITNQVARVLKLHQDVYYVYYLAANVQLANVQLANGNIKEYEAYVKRANKELKAMEELLGKVATVAPPKKQNPSNTNTIHPSTLL